MEERGRWQARLDSLRPPSGETKGEGFLAGCGAFKSEDDGELDSLRWPPSGGTKGEGLVAGGGAVKTEGDGELDSLRWPPSGGTKGEGLVAGCGAVKSEDDGELEIEGEGLVAGCVDRAAAIRRALCSAGDDHGDTLACATPVRCRAQGELANGWGDDVDTFSFRVNGWQTVEIATCSGFASSGELFDAAGQRLHTADGEDGFRLVRTLGPGTYFLRVAGESGSYGLAIRTLDR